MKRRTFLQIFALGALTAGCGNTNNDQVINVNGSTVGPTTGNTSAFPVVARSSLDGSFAFGPQGDLYQVNTLAGKVSRTSAQGQLLWTAGTRGRGPTDLDTPVAVALDTLSRAWVVDQGFSRIQLYDAAGAVAGLVGEGQLKIPQDVALSSDRAYVSDALDHRVAIFDLNGQLVGELGHDELNYPRGVALDQIGRLHVADAARGEILVFTRDGSRVGHYGAPGEGTGSFQHARGLAIRQVDGLIAVVDSFQRDIELFSPSFQSLGSFRPDIRPRDLQFGPDGKLYINGDRRLEVGV